MAPTELAKLKGKEELLMYLLRVAKETQGAEVWRALFAEMLARVVGELRTEGIVVKDGGEK